MLCLWRHTLCFFLVTTPIFVSTNGYVLDKDVGPDALFGRGVMYFLGPGCAGDRTVQGS